MQEMNMNEELNCMETGSSNPAAPLLVFLHGLGSCAQDWMFQFPNFENEYRILALDFPGHGASAAITSWPDAAGMAARVLGTIRARSAQPFHLVGLSLGGMIALQLALDYPERIRTLTIVNAYASAPFSRLMLRQMLGRVPRFVRGNMYELGRWIAADLFPGVEKELFRELAAQRIAAVPRGTYARMVALIMRFNVAAQLTQIQQPVQVIAGAADRTVPLFAKQRLAEGLPGAQFHLVPDSGHGTPLDAPDEFNQLLSSFLESADRAIL